MNMGKFQSVKKQNLGEFFQDFITENMHGSV